MTETISDYNDRLECPLCGKIDLNEYDFEEMCLWEDGKSTEVECKHCEGEYVISVSVSCTYTGSVKEEEKQ